MEETLRALGEILLKAVPTFVLVFLLYLYLSRMFFRPLEEVLKKRYEATEGARKLADESLAKAAAKTAEYEAAWASGQAAPLTPDERTQLVRRAKVLAWGGNAWHVVEFAIAVGAGIAAGSIALVGFGADSLIEASAGLVVVWLFTGRRLGSERAERRAQQMIALSYALVGLVLSPYLYVALKNAPTGAIRPLGENSADLLSFVLPRTATLIGGGTFARQSPFGCWFEDVRALGFLRPPWGLAYDRLFAATWRAPTTE